jgi:Fur family ferric uptake transcriptional regulator
MPRELDPAVQKRVDDFIIAKGLKRTKQRQVIIQAALTTNEHFTADELWEMARLLDRTTSRSTLYRTLGLLVESGLLREIDLGRDQTVYDPNFIDSPNHNHLICIDCQRVVEFEDHHISLLEDCITRRLGFSPASKSIRIEAHCDELKKHGVCKSRR